MDNHGNTGGFIGNILAAISIIGACASFLAQNYAIITVPFSVAAALYAIRYYRAATHYYNEKKKRNDGKSKH